MLATLSIFNFAVIENLELNFTDGMTAITGESGSGKSVIMEAIKFIMGYRASHELILKDKTQRTDVRACFDVSKMAEFHQWLKSSDLDHGTECLLRRVMTTDGRSRAYINGIPTTLSQLKQAAHQLIHLHGQHGYQSLMDTSLQRDMLDNYTGCQNQARKVRQILRAYKKNEEKIQSLSKEAKAKASQLQLLHYQMDELDELSVTENELETLEKEQALLSKAGESRLLCYKTHAMLTEEENSVSRQLHYCLKQLSVLPAFKEVSKLLEDAVIQVDEACTTLNDIERQVEFDPEKLACMEHRLSMIHDIARKHKVPPHDLPKLRTQLSERLESCESSNKSLALLEKQGEELKKSFFINAEDLGKQRKKGAIQLEKAINNILKKIAMRDATFSIAHTALKSEDYSGMDKVVFQIKEKHHDAPVAIDKVASGGELSRLSLVIQIVTAKSNEIKTLLFDEVDSGIGGATAEMVGRLLRQLGGEKQVLCITHQAQVASQANTHLSVSKNKQKHAQLNTVQPLNNVLREREVARMIAGMEITAPALAYAREMICRTHKVENT